MRAYKRTSSEQEVQVSDILFDVNATKSTKDILFGVNATKSKKIKEQDRCETLDKGCVEIKKYVNQSSPKRISGDKSINTNISFNVN